MPSPGNELQIGIIITTVILLLLVAFILFLVVVFRDRQKKARAHLEKELINAQMEIQEQTLKTISQEIHDNIGQVLSLAKLNLNTFSIHPDEKVQLKLNDTKELVGKAITDLRNISRGMHGDKITDIGLQQAIENELRILENSGQYNTELEVVGEEYKLDPKKEIVVFRMVQEALQNSIKHAKAKSIHVKLENSENKYIVSITDNGIGFNKESLQSSQTGIGLKNMQNRAAVINGVFFINTEPGHGTAIQIALNK